MADAPRRPGGARGPRPERRSSLSRAPDGGDRSPAADDAAAHARASLAERLRERGREDVRVVATRNRVRLASVRRRSGVCELRVTQRLLEAGIEAVEPLVALVEGHRDGARRLRRLEATLPPPDPGPRRRVHLRPCGRVYDLRELMAEESARLDDPGEGSRITWGPRRPVRPGQRSIRLGSYRIEDRLIRIHPLLDRADVPRWFVGFVVFHELLHDRLGFEERGGRRILHPPAFERLEAQHPHRDAACRWEREELPRLLGRGRRS